MMYSDVNHKRLEFTVVLVKKLGQQPRTRTRSRHRDCFKFLSPFERGALKSRSDKRVFHDGIKLWITWTS